MKFLGWLLALIPALALAQGTISPVNGVTATTGGGGGAVNSVTGSSGITCSPTTGSVVCSGAGGAVSSVSGSGGVVGVSPTTGATVVSLLPQAVNCTVANTTGGSASPLCVTLTNFQAAMIVANAKLVTDPTPGTTTAIPYNPSGFGTSTGRLYVTPAAGGTTMPSLLAGSDGQQLVICNAEAAGGNDPIFILNQSTQDTTAANRFEDVGTVLIQPGGCSNAIYTAQSISRWKAQ